MCDFSWGDLVCTFDGTLKSKSWETDRVENNTQHAHFSPSFSSNKTTFKQLLKGEKLRVDYFLLLVVLDWCPVLERLLTGIGIASSLSNTGHQPITTKRLLAMLMPVSTLITLYVFGSVWAVINKWWIRICVWAVINNLWILILGLLIFWPA